MNCFQKDAILIIGAILVALFAPLLSPVACLLALVSKGG